MNSIAESSNKMKEEVLNQYMLYGDMESAAKFIITNEFYSSTACTHHLILPLLPASQRSNLEKLNFEDGAKMEENWDDDDTCQPNITKTSKSDWRQNDDDEKECIELPAFEVVEPTSQEIEWELEKNMDDKNAEGNPTLEYFASQSSPNYYVCHIPPDCIQMISEPTKMKQLCEWITATTNSAEEQPIISGFDSEWKPLLSRKLGAALLQLAFKNKIFIIDIVTLKVNPEEDNSIWKNLRKSYFENEVFMYIFVFISQWPKIKSLLFYLVCRP